MADHAALANVLEKPGLRLEGRLQEKEYLEDRWWDVILYGILKQEWGAIRKDGGME